jgi:S1-C subfamily serine protease
MAGSMLPRRVSCALAGAGLWLFGACAIPQPVPPERTAPAPIVLSAPEPHLVEFERLIVRLPPNQDVGDVFVGTRKVDDVRWRQSLVETLAFNVAASDELRTHGYRVSEPADRLFSEGEMRRTRLRLGGIVRQLRANLFYGGPARIRGAAEVEVSVEFQLYDALEKRVLFSRVFQGYATETGSKPDPINAAILDAFRYLLSEPDFVARFQSISEEPSVAAAEPLSVRACPERGGMASGSIDEVLDAVTIVQVSAGQGAGVLISPDGHILTSAHLVSGLDAVQVKLRSGIQLQARVLRSDVVQDVAVLRLPGRGYACVGLARDGAPPPGTDVFAVGSPLGGELSWSVSRGVISGVRDLDGRQLLQTDASLNPGNSGGPLIDSHLRVLGIVSFKVAGDGIEGIGFGVPADVVEERLGLSWQP